MTSSTLATRIPNPAETMSEETCGVCPHPRAEHDKIAARFCSATGDGAFVRGCVCQN